MKLSTLNSQLSTGVRERPILMCGEMVLATLDDRKTQTRRVVQPQPKGIVARQPNFDGLFSETSDPVTRYFASPYGKPGDRLWVKETFYIDHCEYLGKLAGLPPLDEDQKRAMLYYAADGDVCQQIPECECSDGPPKLRPSIFMPRWASRLTLEIVNIRVERVQEISAPDCEGEGIFINQNGFWHWSEGSAIGAVDSRHAYQILWDQINKTRAAGAFAWDKNPWVWVLEFKRLTP